MDGTSIGLSKHTSYFIGAGLMALALIMFLPPPFSFGDDFLINVPIAFALNAFGIPILTALIITYTVIPMALFLMGAWFYPGPTVMLIKRKIKKATNTSKRLYKNPWVLLVAGIIIILLWSWYADGGSSLLEGLI